jgi:hypothetical protein
MPRIILRSVAPVHPYGKIQAVIPEKGNHLVLGNGNRLEEREYLFPEEIPDKLPVERLHIPALVEYDMVPLQFGQYLMLIDAYTVFELTVYLIVDLPQQFGGGLYRLFVISDDTRSDRLMIGHANLIELFEIGRIDGYKVYSFVQGKPVVVRFEQHAVVERQPTDVSFEIAIFHFPWA